MYIRTNSLMKIYTYTHTHVLTHSIIITYTLTCIYIYYTYKLTDENIHIYTYTLTSVFDKLIWCTIGPKSFLFGTTQFSLWARGAVKYDYVVTNSLVNWLKMYS